MKRTKMILGLLLVAALMIGVTFSTYAFFTSEARSNNNVFDTATLKITATDVKGEVATMNLENIWPGEEGGKTGTIVIKNDGTMDLKYKVSAQHSKGNKDLYNSLYVKITRPNGAIAYEGKLNELNGYLMNSNLGVKKSEKLTFKVTLDPTANNTLQGVDTVVSFVFDATQWDNTEMNWANVYKNITPPTVKPEHIGGGLFTAGSGFISLGDGAYCVEIDTVNNLSTLKLKRYEITIYDVDGNLIRTILGSPTLLESISNDKITKACSVTIPGEKTLWFGSNNWMIGSWIRNTEPAYAIVRLTDGNGVIHEIRLDLH